MKTRFGAAVILGLLSATISLAAAETIVQKRGRPGVTPGALTGKWKFDPEASGAAPGGAPAGGGGGGGGRGGFAGDLTVTHTADQLSVERSLGDTKVASTYKLDGTASTNVVQGRGGTSESVSVARQEDDGIVITTKQRVGDQTMESTQRWSVSGDTLTIETTNARGTLRRVYKRAQ